MKAPSLDGFEKVFSQMTGLNHTEPSLVELYVNRETKQVIEVNRGLAPMWRGPVTYEGTLPPAIGGVSPTRPTVPGQEKAQLTLVVATIERLAAERDQVAEVLSRKINRTPEQTAELAARVAVLDVQLTALRAEKARLELRVRLPKEAFFA